MRILRLPFHFLAVLLVMGFFAPFNAQAMIPKQQTELILENIKPILPKVQIDEQEVRKVIPTDIKSGASADEVEQKILDCSTKSLVEGKMFQSPFLDSAKKIESALRPNLSLGKSPSGVQHQLNLDYQAFQNRANMSYAGFLEATANFDLSARSLKLVFARMVGTGTKVILDHQANLDSSIEMLRFQWNW